MIATWFTPVLDGSVATRTEFAMVVVAFAALLAGRVPPWGVVLAGALVVQVFQARARKNGMPAAL